MSYLFRTARLGFRRYLASDGAALAPVFADPYAARFYPAMGTPEAVDRWVGWNLKNYEEHGFGLWALELLDTGDFVGDSGITWQSAESRRILEIGWHIHPDFRARGYATEAGKACLDFGFGTLGASSLASIVDPANAASITVATRVHQQHRQYHAANQAMLLFYSNAPHNPSGLQHPHDH